MIWFSQTQWYDSVEFAEQQFVHHFLVQKIDFANNTSFTRMMDLAVNAVARQVRLVSATKCAEQRIPGGRDPSSLGTVGTQGFIP